MVVVIGAKVIFIFDLAGVVFAADGTFEESNCGGEGVVSLGAR